MLYFRKLSEQLLAQLDAVDTSVRERVLQTESLPPDPRFTPRIRKVARARRARTVAIMNGNLLRLHRAGVPVVLGTDAGNPLTLHGPSVFAEMEAMQSAGLSAREVLTASTQTAAAAMQRAADLGRIAVGYVADLLVLEKDPGQDIANMRSITQVCRAGVLRRRDALLGK